jgi:hypothetical protein
MPFSELPVSELSVSELPVSELHLSELYGHRKCYLAVCRFSFLILFLLFFSHCKTNQYKT